MSRPQQGISGLVSTFDNFIALLKTALARNQYCMYVSLAYVDCNFIAIHP